MQFCTPELVDGLARCPRCGVDFPPGDYDLTTLRRPCRPPSEADTSEPLRLWFDHGLGDAVMFTSVLRHLRHYWPERQIELLVRPGQERLFGALADSVECGRPLTNILPGYKRVEFYDCYRSLSGMPSTKVETCLLQEFGLTPLPELWDYWVTSHDDATHAAEEFIAIMGFRQDRLAFLHYQGHCVRENKDLTHRQAMDVARVLAEEFDTVLLWDPDKASPLPDMLENVVRLSLRPDAAILGTVLQSCELCVGIDSGPAHLATAVGTQTVVIWTRHHPLFYYSPTPLAFHLLPVGREDIHEPKDVGREFFDGNYRSATYEQERLGEAVRAALLNI